MQTKKVSIAAFVVSVIALTGLIQNHGLFASLPAAIGLQILAALLMLWARVTFGSRSFHAAANPTAGGLVTTGPYKLIRHPIYASVVFFTVVGVLANWSLLNGGLGTVVIAGMITRSLCEERLLREQFPEYAAYARRSWRMFPYIF